MSTTICEKCGRGWSSQHTCQKDGSFTINHLSDIPYDSALVELLKHATLSRNKTDLIIAYELGRRKALMK